MVGHLLAERDIYRRYFAQQKGENFEHGIEKCSGGHGQRGAV